MTDKTFTSLDVCGLLRDACRAAGGQGKWAVAHSIDKACLSLVLNGHRDPSPAMVAALGLRQVVRYVPKRQIAEAQNKEGVAA